MANPLASDCTTPRERIIPNSWLALALLYAFLAVAYFWWTWSEEPGSWLGDVFFYLLTAEHYSPWHESSALAAYVAHNSKYPPLFPFVLGLFDGGTNILHAHIVTTTLLLLTFLVFYAWLVLEGMSKWQATALVLVFAILPGTYMHALWILSEHLFLLLSLVCLSAVTLAERRKDSRFLLVAAFFIAAATLTRTAGFALVMAFAVYVLLNHIRRPWLLIGIATLPQALWVVFWAATSGVEGPDYLSEVTQEFFTTGWQTMLDQAQHGASNLFLGLFQDISATKVLMPVLGIVIALSIFGALYRAYQKKFDGLYVVVYCILLMLWPYTEEMSRLAYVIVPTVLFQGLAFGLVLSQSLLRQIHLKRLGLQFFFLYVSVIVLISLPALGLAAARMSEPVSEELRPFRPLAWWYSWYIRHDMSQSHRELMHGMVMSKGLRVIRAYVPEEDCIYSVKTDLVFFYARRIGKYPPHETDSATQFYDDLRQGGCRYFFFTNVMTPSISKTRFYPMDRLGKRVRPIIKVSFPENGHNTLVGILAVLNTNMSSN